MWFDGGISRTWPFPDDFNGPATLFRHAANAWLRC